MSLNIGKCTCKYYLGIYQKKSFQNVPGQSDWSRMYNSTGFFKQEDKYIYGFEI